jgi:hypothetical protein
MLGVMAMVTAGMTGRPTGRRGYPLNTKWGDEPETDPRFTEEAKREAKERQERRAAKRAENQRRTLEGIERAKLRIELNSELTGVI